MNPLTPSQAATMLYVSNHLLMYPGPSQNHIVPIGLAMLVDHINEPLLQELAQHFLISCSGNTPFDYHNMVLYISFRFNDIRYQREIPMTYQVSACGIQH